jgi:hypothetical protein
MTVYSAMSWPSSDQMIFSRSDSGPPFLRGGRRAQVGVRVSAYVHTKEKKKR